MPRDLRLVVRYLDEPCLWGWEIRDAADASLVESSFMSAWAAFETRDEARAAGLARLAELVCEPGHLNCGRAPAAAVRLPPAA